MPNHKSPAGRARSTRPRGAPPVLRAARLRLLPALAPLVIVMGSAMVAWEPGWRSMAFLVSIVFYTANWAGVYRLTA